MCGNPTSEEPNLRQTRLWLERLRVLVPEPLAVVRGREAGLCSDPSGSRLDLRVEWAMHTSGLLAPQSGGGVCIDGGGGATTTITKYNSLQCVSLYWWLWSIMSRGL